jgi:hypothetical protein
MLNRLKSLFAGPKPAGPPQVLRASPPTSPRSPNVASGSSTARGTLTLTRRSRLYVSLRWKIPLWRIVS